VGSEGGHGLNHLLQVVERFEWIVTWVTEAVIHSLKLEDVIGDSVRKLSVPGWVRCTSDEQRRGATAP
jgi:hypothetical protein